MTNEQYNKLEFLIGRTSFYPREIELMFQTHREIEGWDYGCSTCPGNIVALAGRLRPQVEAHRNSMLNAQTDEEQSKEEVKPKRIIKKK